MGGIFSRNGIGLGNMFKGISSMLNPDKAYRRAGQETERSFNQAQQFLEPYRQQGQDVYPQLQSAMQKLMNPAQFESEMIGQYEESPYSKFEREKAQNLGLDAASSMGLLGSTPALQALQAGGNRIAAEDRERFIDRMMKKYLAGAEIGQNIYSQSNQFANTMGQNIINQGANRAGAKFSELAAPGNMMGNLIGLAAMMYGNKGGMGGGMAPRQITWNSPQGGF